MGRVNLCVSHILIISVSQSGSTPLMISVLVCVYLETLKYLLYFSETIDHFLVHL